MEKSQLKTMGQPIDSLSSMYQQVGTNMLSKQGKATTFQYPLFHQEDPVILHGKLMDRREYLRNKKLGIFDDEQKQMALQQLRIQHQILNKKDDLATFTSKIQREREAIKRNENYLNKNVGDVSFNEQGPGDQIKAAYDLMYVLQSKQSRVDEKLMAEMHLHAMAAQGIGEWRPEAFLNEQTDKKEDKDLNESYESQY